MSSAGEFEALVAGLSEVKPAAGLEEHPPLGRLAVLGAGPVGQALACECLAAECEVTLYTAFEPERAALAGPRAVTIRGEHLIGTYRFADRASADPASADRSSNQPAIGLRTGIDDAVADADAILIATPAIAHATCAGLLAGRLREDHLVVLVPGRSFGAIDVARSLRRFGARALPTIVELAASPYRVESSGAGALTISAVSAEVPAAALPNRGTERAIARLRTILPMLSAARGVLETTFSDLSGVIDVPRALLRDPESVLREIDDERRRVAFAYGVRELAPAPPSEELPPAPADGDQRVHDALCCSLVPLVSAGELAGVPTRTAAAMVDLGSVLGKLDYARHGRTLPSLGLDRLRPDDIRRALDGGDAALLEQALA
jgi:opine dehydrogenase